MLIGAFVGFVEDRTQDRIELAERIDLCRRQRGVSLHPPRDLVRDRSQRLFIDPRRLGQLHRIAGGKAEMDQRFRLGLLVCFGNTVDPIGFESFEQLRFVERAIGLLRQEGPERSLDAGKAEIGRAAIESLERIDEAHRRRAKSRYCGDDIAETLDEVRACWIRHLFPLDDDRSRLECLSFLYLAEDTQAGRLVQPDDFA